MRRWSVLAALPLVLLGAASCGGPGARPSALAIYYSSAPWAPDGCASTPTVECGAGVLSRFRDVVLTAGIEEPTSPLHDRTAALMARLHLVHPSTRVWGYVSAQGGPVDASFHRQVVYGVADVAARAAQWKAMGASGIFLDELNRCPAAGDPCSTGPGGAPITVDCARIDAVIEAVHSAGLAVFANGGSPDDLAGSCDGSPSQLGPGGAGRPPDMLLVENPTVAGGTLNTGAARHASEQKLEKAARLTAEIGARLAVVDTDSGPVLSDPGASRLERVGWAAAAGVGAADYCFTNRYYSAPADAQADLALPGPDGVSQPTPLPAPR